jgi:predicted RNA-binding protein
MCEADAYWVRENEEDLIMESVDQLIPEGKDTWQLVDIFDDRKHIKGRIAGMSLVAHKIFFEAADDHRD